MHNKIKIHLNSWRRLKKEESICLKAGEVQIRGEILGTPPIAKIGGLQ